MNRISINEPCHENWLAMTPSEQGAFCGKCQIDVIDFSGKSPEQVKLILQESTGKHLCGRFEKTQLDDLNASYIEWNNQSAKVFQSKFLYACLLVFGMTLFSCNTPEEMILGEITVENYQPDSAQSSIENTDSVQIVNTTTETKNTNVEREYVKGEVDYHTYENEFVMGDIAYDPDPIYIMGDTIIVDSFPQNQTDQISCRFGSVIENSPEQTNEPTGTENSITSPLFSAKIFPNPTGTIATLEIDIKETGNFSIDLISMSGEKLMLIYSGELSEGISNHRIDLSVCSTGTYFVRVSSGNYSEIYKILKVE